jgi:phosphoenolpyruvate carboxylase
MEEFENLIDLQRGDFKVVMPSFRSVPLTESYAIIEKFFDGDSQGAFDTTFKLFMARMSPEKVEELYSLEQRQIMLIVTDWMAT